VEENGGSISPRWTPSCASLGPPRESAREGGYNTLHPIPEWGKRRGNGSFPGVKKKATKTHGGRKLSRERITYWSRGEQKLASSLGGKSSPGRRNARKTESFSPHMVSALLRLDLTDDAGTKKSLRSMPQWAPLRLEHPGGVGGGYLAANVAYFTPEPSARRG